MNTPDPTPITAELRAISDSSPGWKTTEFWVHVFLLLGLAAACTVGTLPPQYGALAAAISQAAYSFSRGLAKQGNSN